MIEIPISRRNTGYQIEIVDTNMLYLLTLDKTGRNGLFDEWYDLDHTVIKSDEAVSVIGIDNNPYIDPRLKPSDIGGILTGRPVSRHAATIELLKSFDIHPEIVVFNRQERFDKPYLQYYKSMILHYTPVSVYVDDDNSMVYDWGFAWSKPCYTIEQWRGRK